MHEQEDLPLVFLATVRVNATSCYCEKFSEPLNLLIQKNGAVHPVLIWQDRLGLAPQYTGNIYMMETSEKSGYRVIT